MAARPRTVPTPVTYQAFVNRVWKAETGKKFPYHLRVRDGSHMSLHSGVGGTSRFRNGTYYELRLDLFRAGKMGLGDRWMEVQYVLLHEMAHMLLPTTVNHEQVFYQKAYELYVKYLPEEYLATAVNREVHYKPKYARPAAKHMKLEKYIK